MLIVIVNFTDVLSVVALLVLGLLPPLAVAIKPPVQPAAVLGRSCQPAPPHGSLPATSLSKISSLSTLCSVQYLTRLRVRPNVSAFAFLSTLQCSMVDR